MVKRRHKRKAINNYLLYIFIVLLLVAGFGFYKSFSSKNDDDIIPKKEEVEKPKETVEEIENKNTYLDTVTNKSGVEIKKEWQDVITSYLDLYTKSLMELVTFDVKNLFTNPDGIEAYLTQSTINYQVRHHKMQPNDMRLSSAKYNIEYVSVNIHDNKVVIRFLEDDYYKFNFMNDVSRIIDVENTIEINTGATYTINSLRVVRDNYVMFTNEINMNGSNVKDAIDALKEKYLKLDQEEVEKNKSLLETVNSKKYIASKTCDHPYDRDKALRYANKYADSRNEKYADYSNLGGNCANYGSQVLAAGDIPMDYVGAYQWKYYGDILNERNEASGRSNSWTSTNYFYNYAKGNTGFGLCAEVDGNIFYANAGDIIQVGYNGYTHTTVAVGRIMVDGKVADIALNSNTVGLENYPMLGYTYHNKRLIKVLGYND